MGEPFIELRLKLKLKTYTEVKYWMGELGIEEPEELIEYLLKVFRKCREVYLNIKDISSYMEGR